MFVLLPGGIQKAIGPARTTCTTQGSLPDAQLAASTLPWWSFNSTKHTVEAHGKCDGGATMKKIDGPPSRRGSL